VWCVGGSDGAMVGLTVARAKKRIERCVADAGTVYPARPRKYDGGGGAVTKSRRHRAALG